jgi:hypothetical protein
MKIRCADCGCSLVECKGSKSPFECQNVLRKAVVRVLLTTNLL